MVFISKKENKRQRKVAKRIFKRTGERVGFADSIGGGGGGPPGTKFGSGPLPGDPLFGKIGAGQGNTVTRVSQPISVPSVSRSGTRTRREIQLSEGKKGDLFCEIKIVKGKRKRVCKVKTTDKKRKKPIRVSRNVDKQFGFFGRIL
jgi:hypothetical protein